MMKTIRLGILALAAVAAAPVLAQQGGGDAQPSAREQVRAAQDSVATMKETRTYIEGLKSNAAGQQDVARGECINKQLNAINLLVEVSEGAVTSMQSALAEGNDGLALAEGRKINIAVGKSQEIRALADSCLGDDSSADTTTVVDYEGGDEEADINAQNTGIGNDPPGASPFE